MMFPRAMGGFQDAQPDVDSLLPLLNLLYLASLGLLAVLLSLKKGTPGPNRYGPELDTR